MLRITKEIVVFIQLFLF